MEWPSSFSISLNLCVFNAFIVKLRFYYNRVLKYRVKLTSALRALINNLFEESFDTIFMRNEKAVKIGKKPLLVHTFSGDFHFSP